jgi:hypothetical protein
MKIKKEKMEIKVGNGKLPPMTRELAKNALNDPFIKREIKILAKR